MAQQDSDKKWAVGRLVVSAAAMSATGVGNAVGTMLMPRTAGTLYFKPKDWSKMQLTIWQRDAERLAPLLNMAKRR